MKVPKTKEATPAVSTSGRPVAPLSLLSANYNNGPFLDAFIQSVLDSTVLPEELIIVDDGSTDDSMEVLRRYRHLPFLKIIAFPENRGFTTALNAGLEAAAGQYVMRADPDDLLAPQRIEKQFHYMEAHPGVDVLGCNAWYFLDTPERRINRTNFPQSHQAIVKTYHAGEHGVLHATAVVKRAVFQRYRYQKESPGEDYDLFARMAKDGCIFHNLPEPLYMVRVHGASSSSLLQYDAIERTFRARDRIFGGRTPGLRILLYYWHILHYRKYLLASNMVQRAAYLLIAALLYPSKLLRRIA